MASATSIVKCLRCGKERAFGACPNCGGTSYKLSPLGWMQCSRCEKYRDSWVCECGTENPTQKTIKDCFIATAVFGSPIAKEIDVLRIFRDKTLRKNKVGKAFISYYEKLSPPLAAWIAQHPTAKKIVRILVLSPIISLLKTSREIGKSY